MIPLNALGEFFFNAQKEITSQTDNNLVILASNTYVIWSLKTYLVNLSSKTYVFEDKIT